MILLTAALTTTALAQAPRPAAKDEHVVLDAPEKHVVQANYHNDKAVTLSGPAAGGWHLYAGAAIDAQRINLTMRNVRGNVRFRADWTRVANLIDRAGVRLRQ